jgi:hypothetical protein
MAYLARRPSGTVQIRESVRTADGPRSRTLASFAGPLDDRILDRAARRATRPFDRDELVARAREMGLGFASAAAVAARQLLARLPRTRGLDPMLVGLLREGLAELEGTPVTDDLREAAEWVGRPDDERGATLRDLLRLGDAIVQSRSVTPPPRELDYPQIHTGPAGA